MYVAVISQDSSYVDAIYMHVVKYLRNLGESLLTLFNHQLQMQMLVELIYHLIPPLGASEQHAKLFTAKKNVIMGQSTYMNQLASIAILIVQV